MSIHDFATKTNGKISSIIIKHSFEHTGRIKSQTLFTEMILNNQAINQ